MGAGALSAMVGLLTTQDIFRLKASVRGQLDTQGNLMRAEAVFTQADIDRNGRLSKDEVLGVRARRRDVAPRRAWRAAAVRRARSAPTRAARARLRAPRPPRARRARAPQLVKRLHPQMSELQVDALYVSLDTNRDGTVTLEEFMVWYDREEFDAEDLA